MMRLPIALKHCIYVLGFALVAFTAKSAVAKSPSISPEFINFGYIQNNNILPYVQFETFTHVAAPFVDFIGDGSLHSGTVSSFQNRNAALLPGGAAERAGTKVIMCVRNRSFNETYLANVMQDPSRRATLVQAVKNLAENDPYCAGVNFDFEFSWTSATRDGITEFIHAIRAALPDKEISVYTHAYYDASKWDIPAIIDDIDYLLYSTYDFGTSSARAIADYDDVLREVTEYLNSGVPPEKMVLTWVAYGRRFYSQDPFTDYGSYFGNSKQSQGFNDTLYNTTLRQADNGPFTPIYVRGDETAYYKYSQPDTQFPFITNYFVAVGDTPESLALKISAARNFPGYNGDFHGVRLRGVGWWSMMWVAPYWDNFELGSGGSSFSGYDPLVSQVVKRAPYYRHVDLLVQETLKKPGQTKFQLESFENTDPHWRDPNVSPDTTGDTDGNSSWSWVNAPGGTNRPTETLRAGRLRFDFEDSSNNQLFMRYEMLSNRVEQNIVDTHSALALISVNSRISGYYYVPGNYSNRQIRLAALDGNREVEVSKPITLPESVGWYQFTWDLNDPAQVDPWTTSEPNFNSGDGTVDTSTPGARDVSFLGFILEGGGSGAGNIYFDEITYEDRAPAGASYVVNEFRYGDPAEEFVEIAGPPGPLPVGLQLVSYNANDASQYKSTPLVGRSIPASGILVIGDNGVEGTTGESGFVPFSWNSTTSDLPTVLPGSLQLRDAQTGYVYDSVVYGAYGGVQELARIQTNGVASEGYGWLGTIGNGVDGNSQGYSFGRRPDVPDTNVNQWDFSFMAASPGEPNIVSSLIGSDEAIQFDTQPDGSFQTYQQMRLVDPTSAGLSPSPDGGNAYRCVDTTGGGAIGVFGDAGMGGDSGLDITGEIYIPHGSHPAQAIAVGFCGTQGSTFFSPFPNNSGYEDGYWLIYENGSVDLNDGQPNHPGSFQFVLASNDNLDSAPTTALGSPKPLPNLGAVLGQWTSFRLRVDPTADASEQLVAQVNGSDVYRGAIPEDGPVRGAFMVGFRETDYNITSVEGTWIDGLKIDYATPPARVSDYELY